tara:strand:- start:65 stop:211 length:147 start_codon:yes stop_codon:yes gene_type:complete
MNEKINRVLNYIIKVLIILVLIASLVALVSYTIDVNEPKPKKFSKIEN